MNGKFKIVIEQIAAIIADVFHLAFGNEEHPEHYLPVAQKIWSELHPTA